MVIVEDHPVIRDILIMSLRNGTQYEVEGLSTAEDGISACFDGADLAVFDHRLPDLTGVEAIRRLRLDRRTAHLPIIVVTGEHDATTRMAAIRAGATEFLTKPVNIEEFKLRVRNLLNLHQAQKAARDRGDLLEMLISGADAAIAVADASLPERPLLYVSAALDRASGSEGKTALLRSAFDIPATADPQSQEHARYRQALEGRNAGQFEFQIPHDNGVASWTEVTLQPVPAPGQDARFIVISFKDVSTVKEMRADLTRVEGRLSDIAKMSRAWFFEIDAQLRLSYVSEGMASAFDIAPESILGSHIDDLGVRLKDEAYKRVPLSAVLAQNQTRALHELLSFKLSDGSLRAVQVSMVPFKDSEGAFAGFRGYAGDVSALAEARDQAQMASRAKSAFLATMSHEMRTPLTAILGMADVLGQSDRLGDDKEQLAQISVAANELNQVLSDVLDVARLEDGPLQLNLVPFDLRAVCDQAVGPFSRKAVERGLALRFAYLGEVEDNRLGDGARLAQILRHLLSNAVKFTETGEIRVEVDISRAERVVITIIDSGIGMSEEQVALAFEPFRQIDESISRRYGGQGVGLSIARWLARSMQGDLHLTSEKGCGTTAILSLPLAIAPTVSTSHKGFDLSGRSILVTDDSATNRRLLQLMLRKLNARVTLCEDGETALKTLADQEFDLLLLDINMPRMAGTDLIREIRMREASSNHRPVPALAVTANAMPDQVRDYLRAGFNGCLGKPFTSQKLLETIGQIV